MIVMATSGTQDEVNQSQSVGDSSSTDAHVSQPNTESASSGAIHTTDITTKQSSQLLSNNASTSGTTDQAPHLQPNGTSDATKDGNTVYGTSMLNGDRHDTAGSASFGDQENAQSAGAGADGKEGSADEQSTSDPHQDPSVGSDTDTSRADGTEQSRDGQDKIYRPGAMKKPTSFKSVSVTKNFLAKTASTPPSMVAKVGDRSPATPASQAIAKPRLVAKSGSGIRDSPRPRPGADGSSDGATVWNKNRPAPPAPPKQFTDEELKQQYGIHLASRIRADETGKESKWADIDDEEDDWAPETVVWMDGTKSTINAEAIPLVEPPKPVHVQEEARPQPTKPMLALKRPSQSQAPSGPPKTILRPGAAQQAKAEDAASRLSPQPRQPPGANSVAPPPTKSPWATLPPVDKSLPVFSPPPPSQSQRQEPAQARFDVRDAHGFDTMPKPPPAHEMEADTFDRSWRDSDQRPRELFNSQSGRYEPAPEHRRMSMKQDARHPSLLQRGSNEAGSAAEPSAAFQARTGHAEQPSWARRRGSSVSGTSGSAVERQQSATKGSDLPPPQEARSGIVIGHDIAPQAHKADPSEVQRLQEQQAADRAEEVAKQKRIMQEKRELAIRRRKEEEEREEAERKERIRIKMESLGMAPLESKQAPVEGAQTSLENAAQQQAGEKAQASKAIATAEVTIPAATSAATAPQFEDQRTSKASLSPRRSNQAQAQPLLNAKSDPGPQPIVRTQPAVSEGPSVSSPAQPVDQPPLRQKEPSPRGPSRTLSSSHNIPPSSYSSPGEQKAQPAFRSPALGADTFATWGPSGMTSHTTPGGNVWGPPTSGRGIGNGAFDTGYSRFASRPHQQTNGILPSAGPFSSQQSHRAPARPLRQEDTSPMMHQQLLSDQNLASLGLVDGLPSDSLAATSTGVSPVASHARPQQLSPIAPPQRTPARPQGQQPAPATGIAAWNKFAQQAPVQRALSTEEVRKAKEAAPRENKWATTYKNVAQTNNWLGGGRVASSQAELTPESKVIMPEAVSTLPSIASPTPPVTETQQSMSQQVIGTPAQAIKESTVRLPHGPSSFTKGLSAHTPPRVALTHSAGPQQSRFFPVALYGGSPPPEESDHPVFSGDARRPVVNLPAPKPQVRLPPSLAPIHTTQAQQSPVTMPQRQASHRVGPQPLVNSADWQARFNGLFGRIQTTTFTPPSPPGTPPKTSVPAMAVMSSSKDDLLDYAESGTTTVSLPRSPTTASASEEDIAVKPTVDDIFDGELSFGSIPKVAVPRNATYPEPYTGRRVSLLKMRPNAKFDKPVYPETKKSYPMTFDDLKLTVTVHLPGSQSSTSVKLNVNTRPAHSSRKSSSRFHKDKGEMKSTPPVSRRTSSTRTPSGSVNVTSSENANLSPKGKPAFKKPYKGRKPSGKAAVA